MEAANILTKTLLAATASSTLRDSTLQPHKRMDINHELASIR